MGIQLMVEIMRINESENDEEKIRQKKDQGAEHKLGCPERKNQWEMTQLLLVSQFII